MVGMGSRLLETQLTYCGRMQAGEAGALLLRAGTQGTESSRPQSGCGWPGSGNSLGAVSILERKGAASVGGEREGHRKRQRWAVGMKH